MWIIAWIAFLLTVTRLVLTLTFPMKVEVERMGWHYYFGVTAEAFLTAILSGRVLGWW